MSEMRIGKCALRVGERVLLFEEAQVIIGIAHRSDGMLDVSFGTPDSGELSIVLRYRRDPKSGVLINDNGGNAESCESNMPSPMQS